jgi:hypothetical protein
MRKEARKAVYREFTKALSGLCPMFAHAGEQDAFSDYIYHWRFCDDLTFFLCLHLSPKSYKDCFMVECAWTNGIAPPVLCQWYPELREPDFLKDGRFRLPQLWRNEWDSKVEPWWDVSGPFEQKAKEESEDAVRKVHDYALPVFLKIAALRGLELS